MKGEYSSSTSANGTWLAVVDYVYELAESILGRKWHIRLNLAITLLLLFIMLFLNGLIQSQHSLPNCTIDIQRSFPLERVVDSLNAIRFW